MFIPCKSQLLSVEEREILAQRLKEKFNDFFSYLPEINKCETDSLQQRYKKITLDLFWNENAMIQINNDKPRLLRKVFDKKRLWKKFYTLSSKSLHVPKFEFDNKACGDFLNGDTISIKCKQTFHDGYHCKEDLCLKICQQHIILGEHEERTWIVKFNNIRITDKHIYFID